MVITTQVPIDASDATINNTWTVNFLSLPNERIVPDTATVLLSLITCEICGMTTSSKEFGLEVRQRTLLRDLSCTPISEIQITVSNG